MSVMTSGTYRHMSMNKAGATGMLRCPHGQTHPHDTVSVTVIHDNPTVVDAWSIALLAITDQQGLAALFITKHNNQIDEARAQAWRSMRTIEVNKC